MEFGIIGFPLGHSFSPDYFNKKFRELNLHSYNYLAFPLEDISILPKMIEQNPLLLGLSITIPHKESVLQFLDFKSKVVEEIGACNCIKIIRKPNKIQLHGFNTDVIGFEKSLLNFIGNFRPKALILGSGGASKAAQFVLRKIGIDFKVVSRAKYDNRLFYNEINQTILDEFHLIINTTPLGMLPNIDSKPEIPYRFLTPNHFLFDMVYNPEETAFLKEGRIGGTKIKNGLEMLHFQAEAAWNIWENG